MRKDNFTARDLGQKFNVPVDTIKRWSRELLPPDPIAGRQGGRARLFDLDEAFIIYLASYLIRNEGYSISDSRQIVYDLKPWLIASGLFPSRIGPNGLTNMFYELYIQKKNHEDFFRYDTKKIMTKTEFEEEGERKKFVETYILEPISGQKPINGIENTKVLRVSIIILYFLGLIGWKRKP